MAAVTFKEVSKVYPNGTRAVDRVSLAIADGEFLVLVGPSGCGKSTLIRLLSGLETATSGALFIGEKAVDDLPPQARNTAMVFQNYALYPHMSVRQNLAFPLKMQKLSKSVILEKVTRTSRLLGLEALLDRKPRQLSGGQRQRVAMGRAIVREPEVYLMDEPLSNLDAKLRTQIRRDIAELQATLKTTTLYVTHDQVEAMTLGHRICVLRDGQVQQVGTPAEIYGQPANRFVGTFFGNPGMNIVDTRVGQLEGNRVSLLIGEQSMSVPVTEGGMAALHLGEPYLLGIRPESLVPVISDAQENTLNVTLASREHLGHERLLHGTVSSASGATPVSVRCPAVGPVPELGTMRFGLGAGSVHLFRGAAPFERVCSMAL